jgi:hypothetical protein
MKSAWTARALAVAALLGALALGVARRGTPPPTTEEAISGAIYDTMNAARAGDVSRYLSGYTGPMRVSLERSLDESGRPAFVRYLQGLDSGVKGLAVRVESSGEREAKARLDYVYQERNDVQVVYLEKVQGAWRIARTERDQTMKAAIPYGTPMR